MKKRVADIIMDMLVEYGIKDCFAVVGGGAMHLDNALLHCKNMHKVFCHHEQSCAMAADAYARLSGKMAAVCVTSGPGATNTLTGVMGAWQDSLPMIVLSGQVRYAISVPQSGLNLRYRGIQEYQIVPAVKHMTKYAVMITDPLQIKNELAKAINIALDGRRGPVWIDVPADIQSAMVEEDDLALIEDYTSAVPTININEVSELLELIKSAKRPCILGGSGIVASHERTRFEQFVDKIKIPVIGGSWVADNLYTDYPFYFGNSGNVGPRTGNFILQNADCILAIGNSLGFRQTGFNQEEFAKNAKIIMIDADLDEPKKPGLNIFKHIHCNIKDFFDAVDDLEIESESYNDWIAYCNELKERFTPYEAIENIDMNERVCSYYFWKIMEECEPDDAIYALGNNSANTAKLQIGVSKSQQRTLTNYTCGSMGYDLPAAIGAAIASDKTIYCVTGDGSIMMNLQELQTIKGYNLPVKIIVFSNEGYNAIRQTSKNFFNGEIIGCTPETGVTFPDFSKIAKAFGYEYKKCSSNAELKDSLQWIVESNDSVFLEIEQRLDDPVTPRLMSRMDENGVMQTPKLEDLYPFLDKSEMDRLMISKHE